MGAAALAPLGGSLAAAGAGALATRLFGGKKKAQAPTLVGFQGGGLTGTPTGGGTSFRVTSSRGRQELVSRGRGVLSGLAEQLRDLLPEVAPGFGRLTQARQQVFGQARERLSNRRRALLGDLQEGFAARRLGGSSFAIDRLGAVSREFEQAEQDLAAAEAEQRGLSFLEELQLTTNFITQSSQAELQSFNLGLSELNLQAELASKLSGQVQQALTVATQTQNELAAQAARGTGQFAGSLFQPGVDAIQKSVSDAIQKMLQGGRTDTRIATPSALQLSGPF